MILNDAEITELAVNGMITPFQIQLIREVGICGHADRVNTKINPKKLY